MINLVRFLMVTSQFLWTSIAISQELIFKNAQDELYGQFLAPFENQTSKATLIFVHGDGPMDHEAQGYYPFIWNQLRQEGFAIFSWDKPGIGKSSGNWLNQSMRDRQNEVQAAIATLKQHKLNANGKIGVIGFSQAGWIIPPILARNNQIDFAIGIGFATSWIEQGQYYTRTKYRLNHEQTEADLALKRLDSQIQFLNSAPSYDAYLKFETGDPMSQDRFNFVLKNFKSDSLHYYANISQPMLVLWGDSDLNVDGQSELHKIANTLPQNSNIRLDFIPNAGHAMLNSKVFDTQKFTLWQWLTLMWQEEDALAPEFMPRVIGWLNNQVKQRKSTD